MHCSLVLLYAADRLTAAPLKDQKFVRSALGMAEEEEAPLQAGWKEYKSAGGEKYYF